MGTIAASETGRGRRIQHLQANPEVLARNGRNATAANAMMVARHDFSTGYLGNCQQ
jgi:hypothetical protein